MAKQQGVDNHYKQMGKAQGGIAYDEAMRKAKVADAGSYTKLGGSSGTIWHTEPDPYVECCNKVLCCGCCCENDTPNDLSTGGSWCVIS